MKNGEDVERTALCLFRNESTNTSPTGQVPISTCKNNKILVVKRVCKYIVGFLSVPMVVVG